MKITTFYALDNPTIQEVEKLLKGKLGDKYTYKTKLKPTSMAAKIVTGGSSNTDSITVIKNAYHRTVVNVTNVKDESTESGRRTSIGFSEHTLAGWLAFLNKEGGLIGSLIIRGIYGNGSGFYEEVEKTIKDNLKGEDKTIDVGLGSLFKKKEK